MACAREEREIGHAWAKHVMREREGRGKVAGNLSSARPNLSFPLLGYMAIWRRKELMLRRFFYFMIVDIHASRISVTMSPLMLLG